MLDCVVVGAGFGGLGAALTLAEAGARVALCETLRYPGGCASTFTRGGLRFEAGATLFAGFGPGQLLARWTERHRLAVRTVALDPVVELRAPGLVLPVPPERERLLARLCALPGAPAGRLRAFFHLQARVARFKLPRRWFRVEALPKTALGKLQRQALARAVAPPA